MRRLALVCLVLTGCTPAELATFTQLDGDSQHAIVEHVVRDAADRYGVDADLYVRIVECESGMRPDAVNRKSGALGLTQQLPQYWPRRAEALGLDPALWFDPRVNAEVGAWMLATQGTAPWAESRRCWS